MISTLDVVVVVDSLRTVLLGGEEGMGGCNIGRCQRSREEGCRRVEFHTLMV